MPDPNLLCTINTLGSANPANLAACLDVVVHNETLAGILATTRLHHLKFNANGLPMLEELADCLVEHVIHYCLSSRNRPSVLTPQQAAKYTQQARRLFVHPPSTPTNPDESGEAGEMLLYFLIETILGAPQMVAKMDLKTNPHLEINGSDGIHMRWHENDGVVDVFFGEAKLYQNVGAAMTEAIKSIEKFHANDMRRHEYAMVTNHFKHADENVRKAVADVLDSGVPGTTARINHACLIGYNWDEYNRLPQTAVDALTAEFRRRYVADAPRLHQTLLNKFENFQRRHLRFEVFFLPFQNVQEFRTAFNRAMD